MNELTKNLKCISMRNGIEIWAEDENIKLLLQKIINTSSHQFIEYNGRIINTADMVGVFNAIDMEEMKRRKNGQWQCDKGKWHDRGEKCNCELPYDDKLKQQRQFEIRQTEQMKKKLKERNKIIEIKSKNKDNEIDISLL